jgi:hypothetical protein
MPWTASMPEKRTPSHGRDRLLSYSNILPEDDAFVELIDWPQIFPKIWGILGWNIYVYHTHLDVSPRLEAPPDRPVAWHQDSMRVNEEIECHPRPRLSLKVGYYLTDVSGPDWGNTLLLPASHLRDELDCPNDGVSSPAGAVSGGQLASWAQAPAATTNTSPSARVGFFMLFFAFWMKSKPGTRRANGRDSPSSSPAVHELRDSTFRANSPAFTGGGESDAVVILSVKQLPSGAVVLGNMGARRAHRDPTIFCPGHGRAKGKPFVEGSPCLAAVGGDRRGGADVVGFAIVAADDHAMIPISECD